MSKHKTIPKKIRGDDIRWMLQLEKSKLYVPIPES